ncbi:NUDIX domain-containing protein [Amycolatopsis sp. NPDC051373]|uniref:NUDIX hydrolase n=1 Tax=Amycolatopsis sp. NPDC051373 TaxID=3155801 RepID=UPI00344C13BE
MSRTDYFDDPHAPAANSIAIAVSAFIQDERGYILMIRRTDNDLYSIPGGQLELGETLSQTAVREVREETGIECEVVSLVGLYSNPKHVVAYDDGEVRQEFSICFRARSLGGTPRTSDESKEVLWVAPDRLDRLNIHRSIRLRIDHGLHDRSEPYFT